MATFATQEARFSPVKRLFSWELAAAVLIYGLIAGIGLGQPLMVVAVIVPYALMLILARPHWIVPFYVPIIYADLLSIATRYYNMPPLARFAGLFLLAAVLGYRTVVQRKWIAHDVMTWWLLLYAVLLAAGIIYARNVDSVTTELIEFTRSFITYLIIICMAITRSRLRAALWALLAIVTLLALFTVYQSLTGNFDSDFGGLAQSRVSEVTSTTDAPRPGGTINDANFYGQWLLLVLPVGLFLLFEGRHPIQRLAGLFSSLAIAAAVIFTYSRGDALALIAMIVMIIIYKRPKPKYLISAAVALLIALPILPGNYLDRLSTVLVTAQSTSTAVADDESIRGRLGAATAAISMFADHPLLGVGRGNYVEYELDYVAGTALALRAKSIPPHDLYLEVAAEFGLAGIFIFGGLLISAFLAVFDARKRLLAIKDDEHAALAVWLGIGLATWLVSSVFLHGAYMYMLWLQIAFIIALRQNRRFLHAQARAINCRTPAE